MNAAFQFSEDWFVNKLAQKFSPSNSQLLGIGDDCAAIPIGNKESLLITTDSLIEGTHFTFDSISPKQLGYKSVAVNLSDIAAMGGTPQYILLSLGWPSKIQASWVKEFIAGVKGILSHYQVELVGGDTVRSSHGVFINVTAFGKVKNKNIKKRGSAQIGDSVYVTKTLGDSVFGLAALNHGYTTKEVRSVIKRHLQPKPEVREGKWLGQQKAVHAMMDLSDGLMTDLPRMAEASQCGFEIETSWIPISRGAQKTSEFLKKDPLVAAINGGEDYALLFTVDSKSEARVIKEYHSKFSRRLHKIGKVIPQNKILFTKNSIPISIADESFQHFQKEK